MFTNPMQVFILSPSNIFFNFIPSILVFLHFPYLIFSNCASLYFSINNRFYTDPNNLLPTGPQSSSPRLKKNLHLDFTMEIHAEECVFNTNKFEPVCNGYLNCIADFPYYKIVQIKQELVTPKFWFFWPQVNSLRTLIK